MLLGLFNKPDFFLTLAVVPAKIRATYYLNSYYLFSRSYTMAVQKSRVTRSRRGQRRSHDALTASALTTDSLTGEKHRRHHVTPDGYFRGRQVIEKKQEIEKDDED